jgi:hypothetical protein
LPLANLYRSFQRIRKNIEGISSGLNLSLLVGIEPEESPQAFILSPGVLETVDAIAAMGGGENLDIEALC